MMSACHSFPVTTDTGRREEDQRHPAEAGARHQVLRQRGGRLPDGGPAGNQRGGADQ